MSETKSLTNREAINKIKELAKSQICLLCTQVNGEIVSRPMFTQNIDDDGTIWFFSRKDSNKNAQISSEHKVYLMYMNEGKEHYMSLSGYAKVVIDKNKAKEIWTPIVKAWFDEGIDDPQLSLVRVSPEEGHYWDTKSGKLMQTIKIAIATLTGNKDDDGIEGNLNVN